MELTHDRKQKCGRIDEQIDLLKQKLRLIYQGEAFNGKPTKTARSHGKKFQVSVKQETSRILVSSLFHFHFPYFSIRFEHCFLHEKDYE